MAITNNSELAIVGKSGKVYSFTMYSLPTQCEFNTDYPCVYIYFQNSDPIQLIYAGKTTDLPCRFKEHAKNDPHILNDSNYIAISYCSTPDIMDDLEFDILEVNSFKYNKQHN